ncbi:putative gustatory receptor 28a isoform X1 [Temnothorax curvispinosus]|uniref:Gustatory receptor n=1 Tax=Temnothorax curvispinosus TaxID=300111 RepID=A0A6J1QFN3_9HYME|nr:putative gustatory receptor 28a isoform X1 [Temnothorax curvispinosus]
MEEDSGCKNVFDSVENSIFMDAYKINNFFKNLNKDNPAAEKISKQKVIKIKSELHKNSFWMLKMSIIFFKLIGLATFAHHIVMRKKRSLYTFQYSEFGIVYNVILSSLIIASNYLSIPFRLNLEYENKSNLTVGIEVLQTVLGSLVICTILFIYCIDQKSLVRIANRLMDVEHEMDCLYHLYQPLRRQHIFCAMIIVCILKVCLLILLLTTEILAFHTGPVSWLSDILPTFHVGWLLIQYFLLVTIIQADFADVNQAIQSLTRVGTPDLRPQSLYQTRRVVFSNSTVHQLLQLRDMHCHLCEISEDVSDFYSLPVLFGFTFLFLTLIYNGYYLFSPLLMTDNILEYETLSNTFIWLIFLIYPISLLTNRTTKILNEIGKTGNVIHGLLRCAIGKETKSELEEFSLQLLHRKIQFTANGYFTLDNSFLHSLIGTVATYLVILVQFQMGSSCSSRLHLNCTGNDLSNAK